MSAPLLTAPPPFSQPAPVHPNRSEYSLATVDLGHPSASTSPSPSMHERAPLLSASRASYGSGPEQTGLPLLSKSEQRRILLLAGLRMAGVFILSCLLLGGTLWLALPTLADEDRSNLRIPKSFAQLQALNQLLKKYRNIYPYRIVVCYITTYLFLQAFSIPGSMYMSILGGAVWGVPIALPLACACVASGATLCYLISAALGPALLTLPSWRVRLETWSDKVAAQRENLLSYLIVIRIAPLPPHWVVNVLAPHIGIGIPAFWASTFLGVFGVSVIHTTIGGGLDEMTSTKDFHLISWKNFLVLAGIVVGVLTPVALRFFFKRQVREVIETDVTAQEVSSFVEDDEESRLSSDPILAVGPHATGNKGKLPAATPASQDVVWDEEEYDSASDEDVILEAGPAVVVKPKEDHV